MIGDAITLYGDHATHPDGEATPNGAEIILMIRCATDGAPLWGASRGILDAVRPDSAVYIGSNNLFKLIPRGTGGG